MIDAELLDILCCPETKQKLSPLAGADVDALNAAIARGDLSDRSGKIVREPVEGALRREDGRWAYPVRAGIPVLLVDSALPCGRS